MKTSFAVRQWMWALVGTGLIAAGARADEVASPLQEAAQNVQMDAGVVPCSLVEQSSVLDQPGYAAAPCTPAGYQEGSAPSCGAAPCGCGGAGSACGCGGSGSACGCGMFGGNGCCDPTWIVTTEMTMLHARFLGSNSTIVGPGAGAIGSRTDIDGGSFQRMAWAPRFTFGRQWARYGIQARFWYMSDNSQTNVPLTLANPVGVYGNDALKAFTFDIEGTRQWLFANNAKIVAMGGARYADLSTNGSQTIQANPGVGPDVFTNYGNTSVRFHGVGLTGGVWARRPITASGLSVYGMGRGSVIFGTNTAVASTGSMAASLGGAGTFNYGAPGSSSVSNTLGIGEFQVGLQYDHQLVCCPASFFFRVGFEGQTWNNGTSNAFAFSRSTTTFAGHTSTSTASAGHIDLTLYGLALATGLNW